MSRTISKEGRMLAKSGCIAFLGTTEDEMAGWH